MADKSYQVSHSISREKKGSTTDERKVDGEKFPADNVCNW